MTPAHKPALMDFDGLQIVAPNGWPVLTGRQWSDIEAAMILTANDQRQAAAAVILDFEERIGTRPAHRRAVATGPEALSRDIARTNRARIKAERQRVRELLAPWKAPAPDAKKLAKIDRKLRSNDPKQLAEAKTELVELELDTRAKAEALRTAAEQSEIRRLAEGRGDQVAVESSAGRGFKDRTRIVNADGLELLKNIGSIDDRQFAAGMRYRELYEKTDPERSLKPMQLGTIQAPHHGGENFAKKMGEWVTERLNIERQVVEKGQHRYAILALQETAGRKRMVVDTLKDTRENLSGHRRRRYVAALKMALNIVADELGIR